MKLIGEGGESVELTIVGYEYPSMTASGKNDWDANWLVIQGEVSDGQRRWRFRDPALTTWEASRVASWLRSVASQDVRPSPLNEDEMGGLTFTEPNLGFSLHDRRGDAAVLRVHFSLESAPPWIEGEARYDLYDYFVELLITFDQIESAVRAWESENAIFRAR